MWVVRFHIEVHSSYIYETLLEIHTETCLKEYHSLNSNYINKLICCLLKIILHMLTSAIGAKLLSSVALLPASAAEESSPRIGVVSWVLWWISIHSLPFFRKSHLNRSSRAFILLILHSFLLIHRPFCVGLCLRSGSTALLLRKSGLLVLRSDLVSSSRPRGSNYHSSP